MSRIHIDVILELGLVKLIVQAKLLLPASFVVKIDVFIGLTLGQGIASFCFAEPRVILLVEHPVFAFQLNRSVVLLIGPLLIVERKKQCVKVEVSEIFASIEHWHGWEH